MSNNYDDSYGEVNEYELLFNQQIKDRRKELTGARGRVSHKKGFKGKVITPVDLLKGEEKKKYKGIGGIKVSYLPEVMMKYDEFLKLSKEDKRFTLIEYMEKYKFTRQQIFEHWSDHPSMKNMDSLNGLFYRLGLAQKRKKADEAEDGKKMKKAEKKLRAEIEEQLRAEYEAKLAASEEELKKKIEIELRPVIESELRPIIENEIIEMLVDKKDEKQLPPVESAGDIEVESLKPIQRQQTPIKLGEQEIEHTFNVNPDVARELAQSLEDIKTDGDAGESVDDLEEDLSLDISQEITGRAFRKFCDKVSGFLNDDSRYIARIILREKGSK